MKKERLSAINFAKLLAISILLVGLVVMCTKPSNDIDPEAPDNKEQIRTEQEDQRDSVPPGHNPDNDDDDPSGGKYDYPRVG